MGGMEIRGATNRLEGIISFEQTKGTLEKARGNKKNVFVQVRKMSVNAIMTSIMARKGLTASMEMRQFAKSSGNRPISKQAWLKARLNLNPEVFSYLNDKYMSMVYEDGAAELWNGYLVCAVDGSKAEIPNSAENRIVYGTLRNQHGGAPARAMVSGLFDVLNGFFIDLQVCNVMKSEAFAAEENIKAIGRIGIKQKVLVIFDRGYPSLELLNYLEEHEISYIIRISSAMYLKERREAEGNDCRVSLDHTYSRLVRIKDNDERREEKRYERMKAKGNTETRLVRDTAPSGDEFAVLTNLPACISGKEITEAYFFRWKVEEAYNSLKNKMNFESVTGLSSIYVEQDFLAQVFVYNMMEDLRHEAEEKIQENPGEYKYPRRINQNVAIGIFKNELITLQMEESGDVKAAKMKALQDEFMKYTLPVRKSKSKPRKFNPSNKYACNLKPSF